MALCKNLKSFILRTVRLRFKVKAWWLVAMWMMYKASPPFPSTCSTVSSMQDLLAKIEFIKYSQSQPLRFFSAVIDVKSEVGSWQLLVVVKVTCVVEAGEGAVGGGVRVLVAGSRGPVA